MGYLKKIPIVVNEKPDFVDKTINYISTYNALYLMVSFTVGLSHAQYMHVSQRAEREGKSVNQIIQEIVEQEMTKGDNK